MADMKVGCGLLLSDEAKAQFKEHTGKLATRLNVKMWAIKTLSENLGIEIETNFSKSQLAKMKKERGSNVPAIRSSKQLHVDADDDAPRKVKTVPTILQRSKDDLKRKKFTLRKK